MADTKLAEQLAAKLKAGLQPVEDEVQDTSDDDRISDDEIIVDEPVEHQPKQERPERPKPSRPAPAELPKPVIEMSTRRDQLHFDVGVHAARNPDAEELLREIMAFIRDLEFDYTSLKTAHGELIAEKAALLDEQRDLVAQLELLTTELAQRPKAKPAPAPGKRNSPKPGGSYSSVKGKKTKGAIDASQIGSEVDPLKRFRQIVWARDEIMAQGVEKLTWSALGRMLTLTGTTVKNSVQVAIDENIPGAEKWKDGPSAE